jgi:hypothetical protein
VPSTRRPAVLRIAAFAFAALVASAAAHAQMREYQAKGAFLLNFARFAEWPTSAHAGANSPLNVCVAAPPWMFSDIEASLRERTVGAHPLQVQPAGESRQCHLLFVGASEPLSVLPRLTSGFTLIVTEHPDGIARGSHINFHMDGSSIRFEIAQQAAKQAQVKLSSRLLSLSTRPR